ncbi:MAG: choice-of-anchor Q domain-containing protein [Saprospiraceae bacterium]
MRLQQCSPAIDAGDNTANSTSEDLDDNPRIVNSLGALEIDLGAYEFQDIVAPTAVCQNQTVQLDGVGNGVLAVASLDGGSMGCAPLTFSVGGETTLTFNCSEVGSNAVTLTVTDKNGSTHTCSATVTVEDKIAPSANCQAYTVQLDANGNGTLSASDIDNGSSDLCGNVSLSASPNTFNCSNIGSNSVTLTVTDDNSNTATCTAQVNVEDITPPTAVYQSHTRSTELAATTV